MAGTGSLQSAGKDLYVHGMMSIFYQARIANLTTGTFTNMSDLETISYTNDSAFMEQLAMSSSIVFALTTTGTVNVVVLYNSSGTMMGYFDVTPVVYATATYYTLSEFLVDVV